MLTEIKNTVTVKINLTENEEDILKKADRIINDFLKELSQATAYELQELAEKDISLSGDFKDIATILTLNGKTLTFEE